MAGESRTLPASPDPPQDDTVTVTLTFALSVEEWDVISEMFRAGGFTSLENLTKVAWWRMGKHLGIPIPPSAFRCR